MLHFACALCAEMPQPATTVHLRAHLGVAGHGKLLLREKKKKINKKIREDASVSPGITFSALQQAQRRFTMARPIAEAIF